MPGLPPFSPQQLVMPDLVGEDSHTQLQVEVLRNLSSGLQGHLSHAAAYGEAVAGSGRPAGSGAG